MDLVIFILLLIVNLVFWYLGWKSSSKGEIDAKMFFFSVIVYVITMDKIYEYKDLIFDEKNFSYWTLTLSLFVLYVFVAFKAVKSNKNSSDI